MNRFIGGILLVSGTTIGAAMLALPVVSSLAGFIPSMIALAVCWVFFFLTAWIFLDVNLACPGEPNMISMVGRTLGVGGKAVCWIVYLLLLYALTAAYIAGSAPLFLHFIEWTFGWSLPQWIGPFPLLVVFGILVYLGTLSVDWMNRWLMVGLVSSFFLLVFFLPQHVQSSLLLRMNFPAISIAIPVMFTSYGFHIIIPTLSTYLSHDKKQLRWIIFIGSFIPFVVYAIWQLLILGTVPVTGEMGLIAAWSAGQSAAVPLAHLLGNNWISTAANAFTFFAIVTSFLGVSLSLSDFLTDGLKMRRFSMGRELACILTFVPPLFFVLAYPRGFILALQFAGVCVAILLCILPALMAWKLPQYRSIWRRGWLLGVILCSLYVVALDIIERCCSG